MGAADLTALLRGARDATRRQWRRSSRTRSPLLSQLARAWLRAHQREALDAVAAVDARAAQVVELRYFAGMTEPEVPEALGVTDRT